MHIHRHRREGTKLNIEIRCGMFRFYGLTIISLLCFLLLIIINYRMMRGGFLSLAKRQAHEQRQRNSESLAKSLASVCAFYGVPFRWRFCTVVDVAE